MGFLKKAVSAISNIAGGSSGALTAVNPWAGAISAGAQTIGGLVAADKSAKSAKQNTAAQINWEREQAQNRIQWAVQDAIKAGINPGVAVGQAPGVSSISPSMPDTSGYNSAGQAITKGIELTQNQQAIDAKSQLDRANARKADVEAGLKPKEIAIQEANADTARMDAETRRQEAFAYIQEITTLLPGKTMQQKQQIMENAIQLAIQQANAPGEISEAKANNRILEATNGLVSLRDAKAAVAGIIGAGAYHYEKGKDRLSSQTIARENRESNERIAKWRQNERGEHSTTYYDKKGKVTGSMRSSYRNYYPMY